MLKVVFFLCSGRLSKDIPWAAEAQQIIVLIVVTIILLVRISYYRLEFFMRKEFTGRLQPRGSSVYMQFLTSQLLIWNSQCCLYIYTRILMTELSVQQQRGAGESVTMAHRQLDRIVFTDNTWDFTNVWINIYWFTQTPHLLQKLHSVVSYLI